MRFRTSCAIATVAIIFLIKLAPVARADSCDDAKEAAQKYIDSYEDIRTIDIDALKRLVHAVCESDDEERIQVFRDEADRVEKEVSDKKKKLDDLKDYATAKL